MAIKNLYIKGDKYYDRKYKFVMHVFINWQKHKPIDKEKVLKLVC
jgi:hypothetical protein